MHVGNRPCCGANRAAKLGKNPVKLRRKNVAVVETVEHSRQDRSRARFKKGQRGQLDSVRKTTSQLRRLSDSNLKAFADELRDDFAFETTPDFETTDKAIALAYEAIRRALGISLYDVQLVAAGCLANRTITEMQTGEGKTLALAPAAVVGGLVGRGAHIINPNLYLAERDCEQLRPAYELLGLTVGLLPERVEDERKRAAYRCDITYGTAYEFGFDYLRDQMTLRNAAQEFPLGHSLLNRLAGKEEQEPRTLQRKPAFALIDEIDNVLIDDASSPLVLAEASGQIANDASVHLLARTLVFHLTAGDDYRLGSSVKGIELTPAGLDKLHRPNIPVPVKRLVRPWPDYVAQALIAEFAFRRDVEYVVVNGEIQLVDGSTGRIFQDRSWQDGLHQAIQTKEGLRITAEQKIQAQITRQRFYSYYPQLAGLTGTATGCEREFKQIYGLGVTPIPLRVPSKRGVLPLRFFANKSAKFRAIADSITEVHATQRPVLVGTSSITESEELAASLRIRRLPFQVLNGLQPNDEAEIVAQAGNAGAITIATNLAGRGTDIKLSDRVKAMGGLHVIVAEMHKSGRIDRQLIGRCARQGDPGTSQSFSSAEDELVLQYGTWIADATCRYADRSGEIYIPIADRLKRLQRMADRIQFARRVALLRHDSSRVSIFAES